MSQMNPAVTGRLKVVSKNIDEQIAAVLQPGETELARFGGVQRRHWLLEMLPFVRLYFLMTRRPCVLVQTDRRLIIVYHTLLRGHVTECRAWDLSAVANVNFVGFWLSGCEVTVRWTNGTAIHVVAPEQPDGRKFAETFQGGGLNGVINQAIRNVVAKAIDRPLPVK